MYYMLLVFTYYDSRRHHTRREQQGGAMTGLKIATMELCDKQELKCQEVTDLLQDILQELQHGIRDNDIRQLNTDTLDTRQKNALYNWITNTIERREHRIRTGE